MKKLEAMLSRTDETIKSNPAIDRMVKSEKLYDIFEYLADILRVTRTQSSLGYK